MVVENNKHRNALPIVLGAWLVVICVVSVPERKFSFEVLAFIVLNGDSSLGLPQTHTGVKHNWGWLKKIDWWPKPRKQTADNILWIWSRIYSNFNCTVCSYDVCEWCVDVCVHLFWILHMERLRTIHKCLLIFIGWALISVVVCELGKQCK